MNSKPHAMDDPLSNFILFGRDLAQAARRETLVRFGCGCAVENKADNGSFDPVTEADRAAETAMRELIQSQFPDHGIQGEEYADKPTSSRYSWSLDPIDGTRSYMCGLPSWVTLIALLEDGEPVGGLIDNPCLDEIYVGFGGKAFVQKNGAQVPIRTSGCTALEDARLSTTDPYLFEPQARERFERLRTAARTLRLGHDGYAYARLAAGTLDLVVECGLKPHDYNALIPVVRGAGGILGDWCGGSDFKAGNVIAAATRELYLSAVSVMRDSV
ncbi:MAG TPA: inositol monophosphatase family protein [Sphingomicrobium sp.]|nr:inositol monophosphatase family protein [Sphingomicrobium sp.]